MLTTIITILEAFTAGANSLVATRDFTELLKKQQSESFTKNEKKQPLRSKVIQVMDELEEARTELNIKESELSELNELLRQFTEFGEAADWLANNRESLSKRAGNFALDKHPRLTKPSGEADSPRKVEQFYWEIDKHLELIYHCLVIGSRDLLDEPIIKLSLPVTAYITAFKFIKKQRISKQLSIKASQEIKECLDYLILRL